MRTALVLVPVLVVLGVACGRAPDDARLPDAGIAYALLDCPAEDAPGLTNACMFDSTGKTYPQDSEIKTLAANPPYGAKFLFAPGFMPAQEDIRTTGPDAALKVYAAPYDVTKSPCCPEDLETNRIAADAVITPDGGVMVIVNQQLPIGTQVSLGFNYGSLYRSRRAPDGGTCSLPDTWLCSASAYNGEYGMRFYVGAAPSTGDAGKTPFVPEDACLLSYNTALVDGGDGCCLRKNGENACDPNVSCNDLSGSDCCLIYATEYTGLGQRCCLYTDGSTVDGAQECQQLLATAPMVPASK